MRQERRKLRLNWSNINLNFFIIIAIGLIFGFFIFIDYFFKNYFPNNAYLEKFELSFKKPKDLELFFKEFLENINKKTFILNYENKYIELSFKNLPIVFDKKNTLESLNNYFKNLSFFNKILIFIAQFNNKIIYKFEISYYIDKNKKNDLENTLVRLNIEQKPIDYSIVFNGEFFEIKKGKIGRIIDFKELKNRIIASYFSNSQKIQIPLKKIYPDITETLASSAKTKANKIISNLPIYLIFQDKRYKLTKDEVSDWIIFKKAKKQGKFLLKLDLEKEKIEQFLLQIAPQINKNPQDALLSYDKNKNVFIKEPAKEGYQFEIKENISYIYNTLLNPENQNEIYLKVAKILPLVRKDTLQDLGIEKLLGEGITDFSGSPSSRIHNIKIGSLKFNKILIEPGKEFSFNNLLGEVGPEQGYKAELVIKNGKIYPEYGGGLCQVSTTLFRAAVYSGLKITERSPHSIVVRYYDPIGFDAAIYPPHPDLRFINNTPGYIYIQSKVEGTKLIFEIYGKDEGKEVKLIGPKILEKNKDGSAKTVLRQVVYKNGKVLFKKSFYSSYKPLSLYEVLRNPLE